MAASVLYRPRRRFRSPYRRRSGSTGTVAVAVAVAALASGAGVKAAAAHGHGQASAGTAVAGNAVAAQVTAFARARVGKVPYLWGGTTDAGMDCSALAQAAYASAGITIGRTSQQQWASEPHVPAGEVTAGDLVFFAGSDGTPSSPGHVGIVTDPARHLMIDAFGTGTYVREEGYGPAASPGTGLGGVVGFTDPAPVTAKAGGGAVALGRRLAAARGWSSGGQWTCLYDLWERESGWNPYAANPSSDARGIPQDINGWADYAPGDVPAQVAWGLSYVSSRYGTPCAAWKFETSHTPNWY